MGVDLYHGRSAWMVAGHLLCNTYLISRELVSSCRAAQLREVDFTLRTLSSSLLDQTMYSYPSLTLSNLLHRFARWSRRTTR